VGGLDKHMRRTCHEAPCGEVDGFAAADVDGGDDLHEELLTRGVFGLWQRSFALTIEIRLTRCNPPAASTGKRSKMGVVRVHDLRC